MSFVLAIDQGTTSSRAILFRDDISIAAAAQQEFPQHFPGLGLGRARAGGHLGSTRGDLPRGDGARPALSAADIAAIGITNQRETVVVWDRVTGQAIHRAIVWQDRRTAEICARLKADGHEPLITREDRADHRSVFLRHQDRLDARSRAGRARPRRARRTRCSAPSTAICCGG